jgi:16S rRNA (uracil1498-N3)-methyltransferase
VPALAGPGELIDLPAEEAEHLTRVLRLTRGAAIRVFDGKGRECLAIVDAVSRGSAQVRIDRVVAAAVEPTLAVTLVQAVLKGDKMDDIVRDAVMMGVAAVQPIITARTESSIAAVERGRRVERWARIAVASAKQCGRAVVPSIGTPKPFADIVHEAGESPPDALALMLVEPGASPAAVPLRELIAAVPSVATLMVGPEGGWTSEEVALGATRCHLVSLGSLTLRADAAPTIGLAALFTRCGVY